MRFEQYIAELSRVKLLEPEKSSGYGRHISRPGMKMREGYLSSLISLWCLNRHCPIGGCRISWILCRKELLA